MDIKHLSLAQSILTKHDTYQYYMSDNSQMNFDSTNILLSLSFTNTNIQPIILVFKQKNNKHFGGTIQGMYIGVNRLFNVMHSKTNRVNSRMMLQLSNAFSGIKQMLLNIFRRQSSLTIH